MILQDKLLASSNKTTIRIAHLCLLLLLLNITTFMPSIALAQHTAETMAKNYAPSAQLHYSIKASKHGFSLDGDAIVQWKIAGDIPNQTYLIKTETRAALLGKILQADSTGTINAHGLAPLQFDEKRLGKPASVTRFDHDNKRISFSESNVTYPIKGGEQDRTSALWQLVSMVRAAPKKVVPGSNWVMFVAGRRDAENWTFNISANETLATALGQITTVHIIKAPPPDSTDQRLDIWLAPGMEWYPVRITFTDADGEVIQQNLESITPIH